MFLSRTTLKDNSSGAALCALFVTPGEPGSVANPINYFPKNVMSSSASYNSLDFDVRSRYINKGELEVTNEVYEYTLITEIRSF